MGGGAPWGGPCAIGGAFITDVGLEGTAGAGTGGPMVNIGSSDLGGAPGMAARKSSAN